MKKIIPILAILGIVILILFGINFVSNIEFNSNKTSKVSLIQDQLIELSEWTSLRYEYHNVIVSRLEQSINVFGIADLNYAETIKLIEYSAYIKAGVDMSQVEITIDEETKTVTLVVPKSKILDHVEETEKTQVEDLLGNIFSDYPTQLVFDEINKNKQEVEEKKIQDGLLIEADNRMKELLTSFIKSMGYEEVNIEFKD